VKREFQPLLRICRANVGFFLIGAGAMNFWRVDNLAGLGLLAVLLGLGLLAALLALRAEGRLWRRGQAGDAAARQQWSRNLADASFDGLLIHRQGLILQMNRALVRMLGVREREWLGQHFSNLARPEQMAALRAELEAPQPQLMEFLLLRANKSELPVEICSHSIEFEGQPATVTALRDISQRQEDAARIARLTQYDAMTGLVNRQLFAELLAEALACCDRDSGTATVFAIDLDQFKAMNARLGWARGDMLLKQVAARMTALAGPEDVLARVAGDKFALLMRSNGAPNRALSLGGQLAAGFHEPFIIDGQLVKLGLSIGIAVYPDHAADADGLLQASAFALTQAERAGGGVAHMFSHEEAGAARQSARREEARGGPGDIQRLGADLRAALGRGEIGLVFQPIFRIAEPPALVGFEALARWRHPVDGLIGPERFIPVADAAGLTHEIGCFVLERACAEAKQAGLRMAVNISAAQLRDVNLAARIRAILRKTGLAPEFLEIEVAEALLLANRAGAPAALEVTAVGVEKPAQLEALRRLGCHDAQGNLLGQACARAQAPAARPVLVAARG
jgi:diguanylate cyclase